MKLPASPPRERGGSHKASGIQAKDRRELGFLMTVASPLAFEGGRGGVIALALSVATLATRAASADEARPSLRLEYDAPTGCPSAGDFAQQVERRRALGPATDGSSPAPTRWLRVEIRRGARRVVGKLVLIGPDGLPSQRTLEAADCRGVASALALIAALALDRNGSPPPAATASAAAPATAPPPPSPASSALAPSAPSASTPVPGPSATSPDSQRPAPAPTTGTDAAGRRDAGETAQPPDVPLAPPAAVRSTATPGPDRPASSGRQVPVSFSATAAGLLAAGMAPEPTTGWTVLAGVSLGREPRAWRAAAAPLLRVGVASALTRSFSGPTGEASFDWIAAVGEACPISFGVGGAAQIRPCLVGEYGVLRATGSETANPASVTRPWAGVGAEMRLSWGLLGPLSLDAAAGALASIERDRFTLATESVFETPPVVARVALGLGIALP
jgi:hypothetical protein